MPVQFAAHPTILYRIGKSPNPLHSPRISGKGRYDDRLGRVAVLYAAMERRTAFMEKLDAFRPSVSEVADALALGPGDAGDSMPASGEISQHYFNRLMAEFRVSAGQRWLDVRSQQTLTVLRHELAFELERLGYRTRFVFGDFLAHHHDVTRVIAGRAIDNGFNGIAYASCHDPLLTYWAIFEGAAIQQVGAFQPLVANDPDLIAVAELWNLKIPKSGS